jgi:hypothetical protein
VTGGQSGADILIHSFQPHEALFILSLSRRKINFAIFNIQYWCHPTYFNIGATLPIYLFFGNIGATLGILVPPYLFTYFFIRAGILSHLGIFEAPYLPTFLFVPPYLFTYFYTYFPAPYRYRPNIGTATQYWYRHIYLPNFRPNIRAALSICLILFLAPW